MTVRLTTPDSYKNLLDNYDTWLFDCDGVLWLDDQAIDGVIEVMGMLRRQGNRFQTDAPHFVLKKIGKKIIFVTNTASKSRKSLKAKFDKLGIYAQAVSLEPGNTILTESDEGQDEIYGSAYSAAVYLSSVITPTKNKKVYVIGMEGLEEELREAGFICLGGTVIFLLGNCHDPSSHQIHSRILPTIPWNLSTCLNSHWTVMLEPWFAHSIRA